MAYRQAPRFYSRRGSGKILNTKDMDFLLGILTGVALCLVYGNYLLRQRKKSGVPKNMNPPPPPSNAFAFDINPSNPATKEQLLWDAVLREDFEEAARLRDLINRK